MQLREAAQKEADRITAEAERKAKGITERAQADEARARRLLEEAREAKRANSRWRGWHQKLSRKAWKTAPWIALAAGVGLAASGEYELARMVGINKYVAALLPVSIDVYCVTAFRAKKDIPYALALMASANVVFHLSEQARLVPEGHSAPWWLTTFVVLIFVAVIWRVHTLMHDAGTGRTRWYGHVDRDGPAYRHGRSYGRPGWYAAPPVQARPVRTRTARPPVRPPLVRLLTQLVRSLYAAPRVTPAPAAVNAGVTSAYSNRTSGVQVASNATARTSTAHSVRTGAAAYEGGVRTGTVTARTTPADGVPAARTSTAGSRSRTTAATTAARTGTATPARTDAELLPLVQALPRDDNGFVTVSRVRTQLSVNYNRAVRLLKEAGLLRPEDADKYLT
ncbi:hypothetical protein LT493_26085 [Streptomyces tricolor]|nr:hypothetical protein [Streptomyces tricolor]